MRGALIAVLVAACGDDETGSAEVHEYEEAKLLIEHNATDEDTGFQGFVDGDEWDHLEIVGPAGSVLFVSTHGGLRGWGLTELFFETQEPPNVRVPIPEALARLPPGEYRFEGQAVDGHRLLGTVDLTHDIPAAPVVTSPAEDAVVDPDGLTITWEAVTTTLDGRPAEIVGYEVIVELAEDPAEPPRGFAGTNLDVHLPASKTRLTIPADFLDRGTAYKFEVLALEVSGHQTITASAFSTMP